MQPSVKMRFMSLAVSAVESVLELEVGAKLLRSFHVPAVHRQQRHVNRLHVTRQCPTRQVAQTNCRTTTAQRVTTSIVHCAPLKAPYSLYLTVNLSNPKIDFYNFCIVLIANKCCTQL